MSNICEGILKNLARHSLTYIISYDYDEENHCFILYRENGFDKNGQSIIQWIFLDKTKESPWEFRDYQNDLSFIGKQDEEEDKSLQFILSTIFKIEDQIEEKGFFNF